MRAYALLLLLQAPIGALSQPPVSQDATCGAAKGSTCLGSSFGPCCSQFGWCGTGNNYCGPGCDPKYGNCNEDAGTPGRRPVSTDARCGPSFGGKTCQGSVFGDCCSPFSWCGSSNAYCAARGCQKGFGRCNTESSSLNSISKSASSPMPKSGVSSTAKSPSVVKTSSTRTSMLSSSYSKAPSFAASQKTPSTSKAIVSPSSSTTKLNTLSRSSSTASHLMSLPASSLSSKPSSSKSPPASSPSTLPQMSSVRPSSTSVSPPAPSLVSFKSSSLSASPPALSSSSPSTPPIISTTPASSSALAIQSTSPSASQATASPIPQGVSSSIAQVISTSGGPPTLSSSASDPQIAASSSPQPNDASPPAISGQSMKTPDPASPTGRPQDSATTSLVLNSPTPTSTEASSSINDDSPPFSPTEPFVAPTDIANFVENYTFEDDPLPTPVEMGSPPITTGLSALDPDLPKACMVDPIQPDVKFQLLAAEDRNPLIRTPGDSIGVMKAPKSQEEYEALGPIEDLKFASFSFATGSNGIFDLVINDSPRKYLARKSDGSVTLLDHSTGSEDESLATTIFDVTCEGRITIRIKSQYYNWTVTDSGSLIKPADGSPDTMYTVPESPATSKKRRRSKSQEGQAPRCNAFPRDLEARVFPGARGLNPNKCGSSSFKVPDLTFGTCCDNHDNDYDTCSTTFEEANNNFLTCMRGTGCDRFNHWYLWPAYPACLRTAQFYYSVVSSLPGEIAFYSANKDRCKCYCPDANPDGCMVGGSLQCLNVHSSDTNNCGACGRKCPDGSRCVNGQCKCPRDQCGDRCVTLSSHPKNCGQCGRVSPSGYCVQGQPYTPPPFCSRGNGFRNGNFKDQTSNWNAVFSIASGSSFVVGFDGAAEDADRLDGILDIANPTRPKFFPSSVNLQTAVKVCPGLTYSLGFQIRRPYSSNLCNYEVYVAGDRLANGVVPQAAAIGTGWQWISGVRVGPFFGERTGVSVAGPELFADFSLRITCIRTGSSQTDSIRVDQFSIVPV